MPDSIRSAQRPRPFQTGRTIFALILREMSTSYGRSALGYLWAILEPAAGILLLTLIFSLVFDSPPIGDSFPLFYASGLLPLMLYLDVSSKVASSLKFSKPLLFYPGVTFVDAIIARFLLNALTQVLIFSIVITFILIAFKVDVILDFSALALGMTMGLMLALGIGTMNCYLMSTFPFWERAWAILNRPLFIVSCVFFLFDGVPYPYRDYLWFNPLVHFIGQIRKGIYPTYSGDYISAYYIFGVSFICLAFGMLLLRRYHQSIANN